MTSKDWQKEALNMRSKAIESIYQAHVDAGNYGAGWIRVDANGYQERIDPKEVTIVYGNPKNVLPDDLRKVLAHCAVRCDGEIQDIAWRYLKEEDDE